MSPGLHYSLCGTGTGYCGRRTPPAGRWRWPPPSAPRPPGRPRLPAAQRPPRPRVPCRGCGGHTRGRARGQRGPHPSPGRRGPPPVLQARPPLGSARPRSPGRPDPLPAASILSRAQRPLGIMAAPRARGLRGRGPGRAEGREPPARLPGGSCSGGRGSGIQTRVQHVHGGGGGEGRGGRGGGGRPGGPEPGAHAARQEGTEETREPLALITGTNSGVM